MKNKNVQIIIGIVVLVALAFGGWKWYQTRQASPEVQAAKAEAEKTELINKVKALTVLPEEEPVLFTVNDANLLKSQQAFFKDAQNGDVLMVFQTGGKALIFRDSENRIINAGPVSFQQPETPAKK